MLIGGTFSHYRILRKIGQGGRGEVFLAEDTILDRKVALKFLSPTTEQRPDVRARFLMEAKCAASIDHPFICKVYETGEVEGQSFIALEFVEGQTLAEKLNAGALPFEEALTVAIQIAEGVAAAHERGLIHRDLKPNNIMICRTGHVKVMDFGLAKQLTAQPAESDDVTSVAGLQTMDGSLIGTPAYMSPEQIRGERADARSDVFGMGLVYFHAFSGVHPFIKRTVQATMGAITYEGTPVLSSFAAQVPAQLSEIVTRMLMKDAASRYPSACEVRDDLIRFRNSFVGPTKAFSQSTVAILPFVDLSPERDQEYFCDGLAEELITALNKLEGLRVASRTSSFRFRGSNVDMREVRERLKVETVLEGSVRKAGDKVRVVVKLVSLETGYPLWSERYDRKFDDIFEIQDEIAQSIAEKLKLSTPCVNDSRSSGNSPDNIRAYEFYLKGRYYWNKRTEENLKRSIDFFQRALAEDPHYTPALAGLAESYVTLGLYGALPPSDAMPAARESAEKALARNHEMPEALNALAATQAVYDWDWSSAERNFKRAINANPNYAAAHQWYAINCLVPCGRFAEGRAAIQKASELEPLSLAVLATSGLVSSCQRDYDAAISEYMKALDLDPNFGIAHYFLGQAYLEKNLIDKAIAQLEQSVVLTNRSPECVAMLGYAYAVAGNRTRAVELVGELEMRSIDRYVSPVQLAWMRLGLADHDKAFAELERAYDRRAADLIWLRVRPVFDAIRSNSRFESLCRRLGL
jgi:eukaryotic-like serine/threonine-protein kinase